MILEDIESKKAEKTWPGIGKGADVKRNYEAVAAYAILDGLEKFNQIYHFF